MLNTPQLITLIIGAILSNSAFSVDCTTSTQLTSSTTPTLTAALNGKTVCVGSTGNWAAQEQHRVGGDLWDYKHGPLSSTNLNDPTDIIGSWSINTTDNTVSYTYHGGTPYVYTLHKVGDTYTFCGDSNTDATIIVGFESGC